MYEVEDVMERIYRFINLFFYLFTNVPSVGCNLRCEYCYIKQHGDEENVLKIDKNKKLFKYFLIYDRV